MYCHTQLTGILHVARLNNNKQDSGSVLKHVNLIPH